MIPEWLFAHTWAELASHAGRAEHSTLIRWASEFGHRAQIARAELRRREELDR